MLTHRLTKNPTLVDHPNAFFAFEASPNKKSFKNTEYKLIFTLFMIRLQGLRYYHSLCC